MKLNVNLVVLPADACEELEALVSQAQQIVARFTDQRPSEVEALRGILGKATRVTAKLRTSAQPLVVSLDITTQVSQD